MNGRLSASILLTDNGFWLVSSLRWKQMSLCHIALSLAYT